MGISIAAIFVLVVTILLVTGLFYFHGATNYLTAQIQDKIDISAYFKDGTSEADILTVKEAILDLSPNIRNISYISKEQALADFSEKHKDNTVLIKALEEVGGNPFLPSLNIATNGDPVQYESITNMLGTSDFSKMIDKIIFPKATIEKVYSITSAVNLFGIILSLILVIIAILVVFNTVKLVIENSKDEIGTMKIVGASDWFIRGPFVIQGIIYGLFAFFICFIISGLFFFFVSSEIEKAIPGFDTFSFFLTNWWIFVLIQLGFGIGVGALSAFIVVKRHLEV
jgi:cell division transport system permease protein